jgi:hypothetical protein
MLYRRPSSLPPTPQASNFSSPRPRRRPRPRAAAGARLLLATCVLALAAVPPALFFYDRPAGAQAGTLVVSVTAAVPVAGPQPGAFTITRQGDTSQPLKVDYSVSGTAARDVDYALEPVTPGVPPSEFGTTFAAGKVGKALSLDGRGQYVLIPDSPSLRPTSLTIEGWVNFSDTTPSQKTIAAKTVNETTDQDSYVLYYFDKKLRGVACRINNCGSQVTFDFEPAGGVWYHVAFTYDGAMNQQKLYLNGVNVATAGGNGVPDYDFHPYLIGADTEFARKNLFFPGLLDEITLYNRALTASEIQSVHAADSAGKCKPDASAPNCVAPPAGIVSWVTGDGNITDLKSVRSPYEPGRVAQSFVFSGGRPDVAPPQFVEYRHNASQDPTAEATLSAWVFLTQLPSERGRAQHIIGKGGQFRLLDLLANNDNRFHFFAGTGFGPSVSSNTVVETGRWYHVAATYKANTELKMYVNGALEKTQAITETRAASGNPLTVGNSFLDRSRLFHGLIDEAQMYNRALSASEIQSIFNADGAGLCKPVVVSGCIQPPAGLVGWWPGDGHARDLVTGARGTLNGYDDLFVGQSVTFPAGQSSVTVNVRPLFSPNSPGKTVVLSVTPDLQNNYAVDEFRNSATVFLRGTSGSREVSLTGVSPDRGGNAGVVTPVVSGRGFKPGVTVKLVGAGEAEIVATRTAPDAAEQSVAATFDLVGKTPGVYDVVVMNTGGAAKTLPAAFTVVQGGAPRLSAGVIGPRVIRLGSEYNYYVQYTNAGDVDAYAVPVYITFPRFVSWRPGFRILRPLQPPTPPDTPPLDFNQLPPDFQIGDQTLVMLFVPVMRADASGVLPLSLKLPADPQFQHVRFKVEVSLGPPLLDPHTSSLIQRPAAQQSNKGGPNGEPVVSGACVRDIIDAVANGLGAAIPGGGCAASVAGFLANSFLDNVATVGVLSAGGDPQAASVGSDVLASALFTLAQCAGRSIPGFGQAISGAQSAAAIVNASRDCRDDPSGEATTEGVTSDDPNEKVGVEGAGPGHYIKGDKLLPYAIYFENKETASAPAQDVTITDRLDPAKFDLSTFDFGVIAFGGRRFTPPAGQKSFVGFVDLRPEKSLLLKIAASLNPDTGVVSWTFNSLDPATGKAPEDPFAGFLPPNRTSPEGQGSVTFTVRPRASLATDTPVTNAARIVFDVNAPIDTNQHLNTIDKTPPASRVDALAATQATHSFAVTWAGTDVGSGVRGYDVFVSENGGPFSLWQSGAAATSAVFYGRASRTYSFHSVARDLVGNSEAAKTVAEATTLTPAGNPIDEARWFVRQHYLDFLNREPDDAGLAFWTDQITHCETRPEAERQGCREVRRVNVSAAFFLSIEFQQTGYLVYRFYKSAYGDATSPGVPGTVPVVRRQEFLPDSQRVGDGVVVGVGDWEQRLEQNKRAFALEFVRRQRFTDAYPASLAPAAFVDALNQKAGGVLSQTERDQLVGELSQNNTDEGRAAALRRVAEDEDLRRAEFNRAFVLMQYYGYLRRNPDDPQDVDFSGWKFWLDKLDQFGGNFVRAEMVKAFIVSIEYRRRFE